VSDDADSLIKAQATLATKRSNFENWWQQIALRVMPAEAQFTVVTDEGQRRSERVFSGKAVIANERFAAVLDELLTPRSQFWHSLAPEDEDLADSQETKIYLERLNKLLFTTRYRPRANFASQKHQGYMSVGAFGNSAMYIDEKVGEGIRYRNTPLRELFWAENHQGQIDTLYRRFDLQARQAAQRAKEEGWQLPAKIAQAATDKPFDTFEFLHCVHPNAERAYGKAGAKGMPWSSHYIALQDRQIVSVGGYNSWPYAIGRYVIAANETYGRGPAAGCWGAILTLNEEKKTILRAGQKEVDPPLLLGEDGALEPFNTRPGALNHGMMSEDGTRLVEVLHTGANIPLGLELMTLENDEIDDAFLVKIFQILAEHPQMTATQVLEIAQQKATLLAPMMGRQQSEDLGPLIEREIDLLARDSRYPWISQDMPDELREAGGRFKIEYRSPLARAMRAQDGVAIQRTLEVLPEALQVDPNCAFVIDVPGSLRELAEINGVPAKLVRDVKMVAQLSAQKQQADQLAQVAAAAPGMSTAALNAAKAEQLRAGA